MYGSIYKGKLFLFFLLFLCNQGILSAKNESILLEAGLLEAHANNHLGKHIVNSLGKLGKSAGKKIIATVKAVKNSPVIQNVLANARVGGKIVKEGAERTLREMGKIPPKIANLVTSLKNKVINIDLNTLDQHTRRATELFLADGPEALTPTQLMAVDGILKAGKTVVGGVAVGCMEQIGEKVLEKVQENMPENKTTKTDVAFAVASSIAINGIEFLRNTATYGFALISAVI